VIEVSCALQYSARADRIDHLDEGNGQGEDQGLITSVVTRAGGPVPRPGTCATAHLRSAAARHARSRADGLGREPDAIAQQPTASRVYALSWDL